MAENDQNDKLASFDVEELRMVIREERETGRVEALDRIVAEAIGHDGRGGQVARLHAEITTLREKVTSLELFRARALTVWAILGALGGVLAGVLGELVKYLLHR